MEIDFADLGSARPPKQWAARYDPTTERERNKTKRSKAPRHSKSAPNISQDLDSRSGTPSDLDSPDILCRHPSGGAPELFLDVDLPPHLLNFGRQMRRHREFSGPPLLTAESEEGFVEYKLRLSSTSTSRFEQLVTQLKFRLSEGNGQCFYFLGVEDNGHPRGLEPEELSASLSTLEAMAIKVSASVVVTRMPPGTEGRRCAVVRVYSPHAVPSGGAEVRIAVAGGAESGKSTLVAVLTRGSDGRPDLDNGRGAARMSVLRHKHEIKSGRTSCVSHQLVGYDEQGAVLNYTRLAALDPGELAHSATKIVRLCDLGGHERFSKTSLHGITSTRPDYIILCVCATTRLSTITLDHLAVALALGVQPLVAITKTDTATPEQLERLAKDISRLVCAARTHASCFDRKEGTATGDLIRGKGEDEVASYGYAVETVEQAQAIAKAMSSRTPHQPEELVVPIFNTSSTLGTSIDLIHAFFNALDTKDATQSEEEGEGGGKEEEKGKGKGKGKQQAALSGLPLSSQTAPQTHFQIDHVFSDVAGVGTVLSGVVVRGSLRVDDLLLFGPGESGTFREVRVTSIHRAQVEVEVACAGQHATIAIELPLESSTSDTETTKSPVSGDVDIDSSASSLANFAFFCEEGGNGSGGSGGGGGISGEGASPIYPLAPDTSRVPSTTENELLLLSMGSSGSELESLSDGHVLSSLPSDVAATVTAITAAAPPTPSVPMRVLRSVDTHPPTKCKSRASLEELSMLGRSWEFAQRLHLGSAASLARSLNSGRQGAAGGGGGKTGAKGLSGGRKGIVLLDTASKPKVSRTFEAVLVILGGQWPAIGSPVVHCGGVRQTATVENISAYPSPSMGSGSLNNTKDEDIEEIYWTPNIARECMAAAGVLLASLPSSSCNASSAASPFPEQAFPYFKHSEGSSQEEEEEEASIGSVVRVSFRFAHRPEWLLPGARLVVRDGSQVSGRVAGAGVVVAVGLKD